jgi:NTP pyrophosphatase (non-canonical NTP hydrolase)
MSNTCPNCGTNEGIGCEAHDLTVGRGVGYSLGDFNPFTLEPVNDIDEFAKFTVGMWFSGTPGKPTKERDLPIMSLGLAGEVGEALEHIKKFIRDGNLDLGALEAELGDVAYYWARICSYFGFAPSRVLAGNIAKLESRRERGVLRGDGDDR